MFHCLRRETDAWGCRQQSCGPVDPLRGEGQHYLKLEDACIPARIVESASWNSHEAQRHVQLQGLCRTVEAQEGPTVHAHCSLSSPGSRSPSTGTEQRKHRPTRSAARWKQQKCKISGLKEQTLAKAADAEKIERENEQLRKRLLAMQRELAAREKHLRILAKYNSLCGTGDKQALTMADSVKELLDLQQASTLSISTVAAMHYDYTNTISILLLQQSEAQTRGEPEDLERTARISSLVVELCTTLSNAFVLNPSLQFQILVHRMDVPEAGLSVPHPSHWDGVAEEVRPTQQQLEAIRACWELKTSRVMDKLHSDIITLCCELEDAVDANSRVRLMELDKKLSTVMLKESMSHRSLCFMLYEILTPLQLARLIVHSFPYFPNVWEVFVRVLALPPC